MNCLPTRTTSFDYGTGSKLKRAPKKKEEGSDGIIIKSKHGMAHRLKPSRRIALPLAHRELINTGKRSHEKKKRI